MKINVQSTGPSGITLHRISRPCPSQTSINARAQSEPLALAWQCQIAHLSSLCHGDQERIAAPVAFRSETLFESSAFDHASSVTHQAVKAQRQTYHVECLQPLEHPKTGETTDAQRRHRVWSTNLTTDNSDIRLASHVERQIHRSVVRVAMRVLGQSVAGQKMHDQRHCHLDASEYPLDLEMLEILPRSFRACLTIEPRLNDLRPDTREVRC